MLRIFGRTTLVSQFMFRSDCDSIRPFRLERLAPSRYGGTGRKGQAADGGYFHSNCGLFRRLFGAPHALCERGDKIGYGSDGFAGRAAL